MKNIFTKHPHSMDETYCEHMKCALSFGVNMILGGFACLIHAFFPFVFKKTGSNFLFKMTKEFVERTPGSEERIEQLSNILEKKTHSCRK